MPIRKRIAKRRPRKRMYRRRTYKPRPQRALTTGKVYNFKRTSTETIPLSTAPGNGWASTVDNKNIYKTWVFSLADSIPDYAEFQALFKYYRIKGVRLQAWLSNNVSQFDAGSNEFANSMLIMYTDRNISGIEMTSEQDFLDSQTRKTQLMTQTGKRPAVDVYMPCNQANAVYGGTVTTDYTYTKPKWVAVTEATTQHYTHSNLIKRIDDFTLSSGSSNYQYMKVNYTIYFQCKKVQ